MTNPIRQYSFTDQICLMLDSSLKALIPTPIARPDYPAQTIQESPLTEGEKRQAARLMRVNHAGEICAQALYQGHNMVSRDNHVSDMMERARNEEVAHLQWCATRLSELHGHQSFLTPLWYMGSLTIGMLAGLTGDSYGLGFMAETERQVVKHLEGHIQRLPNPDEKSRQILKQMRDDERQHTTQAIANGGVDLPQPVKTAMCWTAKIMTTVAYWI